jgi:hypothetical protein
MLLLIRNYHIRTEANLENIKLGDIDETNVYVLKYRNKIKLLINPAVRLDYFKFNYRDKLPIYKTQTEVKISPKLNFIYSKITIYNFL